MVPNAKVQLKNTETSVAAATTSDAEGNYRFVSLAPGSYQMTVDASGFNTTTVAFTLTTSQNLNLPVAMKVAIGIAGSGGDRPGTGPEHGREPQPDDASRRQRWPAFRWRAAT